MTATVPDVGELARAARERRVVVPPSERWPALDLADAYAVQLDGWPSGSPPASGSPATRSV